MSQESELLKIFYEQSPDIKLEKNVCIYLHVNSVAQEIFYVGLGIKNRPFSKDRSKKWHEYAQSIHFNYNVIVIYKNLDYGEASEIEKQLIAQIGRKDKGLGTLVNLRDGGGWSKNYSILNIRFKQKKAKEKVLKLTKLEKLENEIINDALKYETRIEFLFKNPVNYKIAEKLGIMKNIKFKNETIKEKKIVKENQTLQEKNIEALLKVSKYVAEYEEMIGFDLDENFSIVKSSQVLIENQSGFYKGKSN
jgi:hypothetical protein